MINNILALKHTITHSAEARKNVIETFYQLEQGTLDELDFYFKDNDPLFLATGLHQCNNKNVFFFHKLFSFLNCKSTRKDGITIIYGYKAAKLYQLITRAKPQETMINRTLSVMARDKHKGWFELIESIEVSSEQSESFERFEIELSHHIDQLMEEWSLEVV